MTAGWRKGTHQDHPSKPREPFPFQQPFLQCSNRSSSGVVVKQESGSRSWYIVEQAGKARKKPGDLGPPFKSVCLCLPSLNLPGGSQCAPLLQAHLHFFPLLRRAAPRIPLLPCPSPARLGARGGRASESAPDKLRLKQEVSGGAGLPPRPCTEVQE